MSIGIEDKTVLRVGSSNFVSPERVESTGVVKQKTYNVKRRHKDSRRIVKVPFKQKKKSY